MPREISRTRQFKRDYKREKASGRHGNAFDADLKAVLEFLIVDAPLPRR
jgi:mRNA-degrading endonuclease YafQ of YafQ-DinJ toxin-antitoxin module